MRRSEEIGARLAQVCHPRQIAFAAAACTRARAVFAICHGSTPLATFDASLTKLWGAIALYDMSLIVAIFPPLTETYEASCDDTLDRDWLAWLSLATFELPAALTYTKLPAQKMEQSSALLLTLMNEIDTRLGWDGQPRRGPLADLEWAAQTQCADILLADPDNSDIPDPDLIAAGRPMMDAVYGVWEKLAASTGWRMSPPPEPGGRW